MVELITGEMPSAAKKMLWQKHKLKWRNDTGAALLRDGVCYAWVGLDEVEEGVYYCFLVRDFNNVFSDIPKERWSEIQDWAIYEIFKWIFGDLGCKRLIADRRPNSTIASGIVDRFRNGKWTGDHLEFKAEDMVLNPTAKPDFV
jgi:hypothetical protein